MEAKPFSPVIAAHPRRTQVEWAKPSEAQRRQRRARRVMALLRLQSTLNAWLWPVRLVCLVVLLGVDGPLRWTAGAVLFVSIALDVVMWVWGRRRAVRLPRE
jgi:hypothetical protein